MGEWVSVVVRGESLENHSPVDETTLLLAGKHADANSKQLTGLLPIVVFTADCFSALARVASDTKSVLNVARAAK